MEKDIRQDPLFREIEALCTDLRQPGSGQISDAAEISVSPDGQHVVFAATVAEKLEGSLPSRIAMTDLRTGETRILTSGPNSDRLPKFSPDGKRIAFLSDCRRAGDFQLYLLEVASGAAREIAPVDGWVEYLQWSPNGRSILLGVARHGADSSGGQGAMTSQKPADALPSWMPAVETGDENHGWRCVYVYELECDRARQVSLPEMNVWEATWCGNHTLAAFVSPGSGEGLWYSAALSMIEVATGHTLDLHTPKDQVGCLSACPSGQCLAIVEGLCSDRNFVSGDLWLIDTASKSATRIDTQGVDITYTEWRSEQVLLLAGHRGFETVVALCSPQSNRFTEVWSSEEVTTNGIFASVAGIGEFGECALVAESFTRAPEIGVIRRGQYTPVRSFDLAYARYANAIDSVEAVTWTAPDSLDIQGWLLCPKGNKPFPLVVSVHGGPVHHSRPRWLGRSGLHVLTLLKQGFAVFFPNPRGSTGRGQEFVRRVYTDMGGAETGDHLSGLDYLVKQGIADPARLGVTGVSHGGYMASWLITQDCRFAGAVPVAPVTN
jgi:dipeptidyl aminopeptidase/acylaminoacyl peptidase